MPDLAGMVLEFKSKGRMNGTEARCVRLRRGESEEEM
jgi:hypothetical protein